MFICCGIELIGRNAYEIREHCNGKSLNIWEGRRPQGTWVVALNWQEHIFHYNLGGSQDNGCGCRRGSGTMCLWGGHWPKGHREGRRGVRTWRRHMCCCPCGEQKSEVTREMGLDCQAVLNTCLRCVVMTLKWAKTSGVVWFSLGMLDPGGVLGLNEVIYGSHVISGKHMMNGTYFCLTSHFVFLLCMQM